ncbi:hypothetical protein NDI56_11165 [Haloarcula sp. S1CR25-12]|uniref:Uncharacterized protein n=1 Tax=Haloarcula saliterrae TaxID=2950534 RepID=A0ABU2FCG5_9EURY|nr:hypothetical protein [Haloarcula sp. S1CR25-12]MDS0259954.1 hypothetical protein [Haloarcula sp. S1CR25-12]
MPSVPPHCTVETALPPAVADYFRPERETVASYLDLVSDRIDPTAGDPTLGPVQALPWLYVADLTGWRGLALARLLAAERDCPCYRLSPLARDAVDSLWAILDRSADGPVVLHVELRGDTGPVPGTLREALWRGYEYAPGGSDEPVTGEPANVVVVFTDTRPSKRLTSPLPDATAPVSGATLSYAPRDSMTPEHPDGTTTLPAPPALADRTDRLETLLSAALDSVGTDPERAAFVDSAAEALVITHSVIGKQDLLFDVSPRIALKHGHRVERLGVDGALAALRDDLLTQVPQSPTTGELRGTLATLLAADSD